MQLQYNSPNQYQLTINASEFEIVYHALQLMRLTAANDNVALCDNTSTADIALVNTSIVTNLAVIDACTHMRKTMWTYIGSSDK